jgi:predicted amidophosphoribosyltransferase
VLELLLPQRCLVCSRPGRQVCEDCTSGLRRIAQPLCERCGAPTAWPVRRCAECAGRRLAFGQARAAVAYVDPVPSIVRAWKERGDPDRRLKRGHAAERLAAELEVRWSLPCEPLLRRTRGSARQRGLGQAERRRNVAGAFLVRARVPPHVVLVDDVYTTGATAAAAAAALRKGGARRVEVATFARTIRVR